MAVSGFGVIGRNTQGVRLMVTEEQERIVAVARLAEKDEGDDGDEAGAEEVALTVPDDSDAE
jgi:DNA gyrase subunit A